MTRFTDLPEGLSYAQYSEMIQQHAAEGSTSGPNKAESMVHFTKLNAQRMKRLDKTVMLEPRWEEALARLTKRYHWVVFTETWCGDAAQVLPLLHKLESTGQAITMSLLFRDEHPALFEQYLTNGSRSIPKLVAFDAETGEELGQWGPRPEPLQTIVMAYKKQPEVPYAVVSEEVQRWYNLDKTAQIQEEIFLALQEWELAGK